MNDILTPLQSDFLRSFAGSQVCPAFAFTGGTALAAAHLKHRLSEDLDFFTSAPVILTRVPDELDRLAAALGARLSLPRRLPGIVTATIERGPEVLKLDFAHDSPFRLAPAERFEPFGIPMDSFLDIAANKLAALYDRADAKDFVDVYCIATGRMPLAELVEKARQKHVGIDDYWLAQAFHRVTEIVKLPVMLRALDIAELRSFFLREAEAIFPA